MLGRRPAYPYATDLLLTLPFLVDTAGNALDLYDTIVWWDDANHFANWTLLSGAVGALAWRHRVGRWETMAYVVGFGAVAAILWEVGEYFALFAIRLSLTRPMPTRWAMWCSDCPAQSWPVWQPPSYRADPGRRGHAAPPRRHAVRSRGIDFPAI